VKKLNNWNDATCQKRTVSGIKKLKQLQKKYDHLGINFSDLLVEPVEKSKDASASAGKAKKTSEKSKKEIKQLELEDLLGNTINEDSDDEDYVDENDDESEEPTSDEDDSEEEEDLPPPTKSKNMQKKKNTSEDRMADLLKRKPGTGGVQKKKPITTAKVNKKAATQSLQLAVAKKIAKPLQKVGKKLKKK